MSSTDTNQASEDSLERACDIHRGFYDDLVSMSPDGSGCDLVCWVCHILPYKEPAEHIKELEAEIVRLIELIRNEKLKLLAEVREEALSGGLSFELDDGQIVIEVETDLKSITAKLEAELRDNE